MKTSRTMAPMSGMSPMRIHQAERPTSCRRRKPTASPGSSRASDVINDTIREPIARSMIVATTPTMTAKSTQYQYAERDERPLNVTYLPKPSLIASTKVIPFLLSMWQGSFARPYTRAGEGGIPSRVTTAAVALEASRRERRGQIYVALAAVAWSTAGVLQRQLTLDTPTQVLGRAVFATVALLAYVAVVDRGRMVDAFRSVGLPGVAVAVCVAIASASFVGALNHEGVARVLFILAVSPMLAALLARVTLGEPITRRTVFAMGLALAGVSVMLGSPGEGSLAGDALALVCALAFAVVVVITRWRHDVSMAPATCLSPRTL